MTQAKSATFTYCLMSLKACLYLNLCKSWSFEQDWASFFNEILNSKFDARRFLSFFNFYEKNKLIISSRKLFTSTHNKNISSGLPHFVTYSCIKQTTQKRSKKIKKEKWFLCLRSSQSFVVLEFFPLFRNECWMLTFS